MRSRNKELGVIVLATVLLVSLVAFSVGVAGASSFDQQSSDIESSAAADVTGQNSTVTADSTAIETAFVGTVKDEREITLTASGVTINETVADGQRVTFTLGGTAVQTATVTKGSATATFDPSTIDLPAGSNATVGLATGTVDNPTAVSVVHEVVDLDTGYNLLSVSQPATLSMEDVAAVNVWNAETGTYQTVTDFTFDSTARLHRGVYAVGSSETAAVGYTYATQAPAPSVAEMPNGWNFVGSNFAIDSVSQGRTQTLQGDLLDIDAASLPVFDAELKTTLPSDATIGAYQPYWVYVSADGGLDRPIINPSYNRTDREEVLGTDTEATLEISNDAPQSAPANEQIAVPATVTNAGNTAQNDVAIELTVEGESSGTKTIDLEAGESQTVAFDVDLSALSLSPGETVEHTVSVAGESDTDTLDIGERVDSIVLDSVSSLLNENKQPLTDDSVITLSAEPTATNADEDGNGDRVSYPSDTEIPVVATDGNVVGLTGPFVATDTNFANYGNEEFVLNLYDRLLGRSGTILHDEGHGQFYTLTPNGGDDFQAFANYTENNGYEYKTTTNLANDLQNADAVVISSPESFSQSELTALSEFVDNGGVVFLHDQSDFNNFDQTANLNEIATAVNASFRFNDDQVIDDESNTGAEFVPITDNGNARLYPSAFVDRSGLGFELNASKQYQVDVVSVADGDTVNVEFSDGTVEPVRILGIDTPETGSTDERLQEYEGIDDGPALKEKGNGATAYAEQELNGTTVTLSFEESQGLRGNFGRLLGFLEEPDGTTYNAEVIKDGWARVYGSGLDRHGKYLDFEASARQANRGIWNLSDPGATPEVGDSSVEELFFPNPVSVSGNNVPVKSESGEPLVALDSANNVAVVGGPLIEESFEAAEGGPGVDEYESYPFLTNVIEYIGNGTGPVAVDIGHGQFAADFAVSSEDTAYYLRYLEGQSTDVTDSIGLQGIEDVTSDAGAQLLDSNGDPAVRALLVSTPASELSAAERSQITAYAEAGGAVVLLGTAANADAVGNFDPLLADLGTNVGFTTNAVTDDSNNLGGDATVPTTTNFDSAYSELFTAFTPDGPTTQGSLTVDPATAGTAATHNFSFESVAFGESGNNGDEVDTITVEYPDGTSLDGLTEANVTVTLTRTLSSGEDTAEISINSDTYSGSSATFDLSGSAQTDIAGSAEIEIDGVTNPSAGESTATVTFQGDGISESKAFDFTVTSDGPDPLVFDSASSLLNENKQPLTDDSVTVVTAESTATNTDADGSGDAVSYPTETDVPLAAVDGNVVGVTAPLVNDDIDFNSYGNDEFMLNVYDTLLGGSGTILHDEGHGQFYDKSSFSTFAGIANSSGYSYQATSNLETGLSTADAVVITSPGSFTDSELTALSEFVDNGGVVFLHDQSDFEDFDETDNLNEIAAELNVAFRFNDDQVQDSESNAGQSFLPITDEIGTVPEPMEPLVFDSASSLLNESKQPLSNDLVTVVTGESTATNSDADGSGDAVSYPSGTDIPLAAVDGTVVGVTAPLVNDDIDFSSYGNDEFMLNVYDTLLGGSGTVLHDEGHGQFYDKSSFSTFAGIVNSSGYSYQATSTLESDLSSADAVVITSPGSFTDSELTALSEFVDNGGVVFLHDQSDFEDFDETDNLNEIAAELNVAFRFNDDQVQDSESNAGQSFLPVTKEFDIGEFPGLFANRGEA